MSGFQFHNEPEVPHYMTGDEMNKKASTHKARKRVQFKIESKQSVKREESGKNYQSRNINSPYHGGHVAKDKPLGTKVKVESRNINSTCHGGHVEKDKPSGTKVKVLMTKEEAARLLSKCKDGGVLEFKDVAQELVQIPYNRVDIVSSHS